MAKLLDKPYPMPTWRQGKSWDEVDKEQDEIFNSIPKDRLYRHGVADGYAFYYVVSDKPLVLQHIPYGDAYELPYAHIRGLRLSDIEWERNRKRLFGKGFDRS